MDKIKFSVLLPTRNRLNLLKYAVETVIRQDYDNWEIIISDNYSEENIAAYVESLNDTRVKYFRTETFVPVTDNWNHALGKSSGDYIIMLGDDDGLMKGSFRIVSRLIEAHDSPELIYTRALLYAYPGVLPAFPDGFLSVAGCAEFFKKGEKPFFLDKKTAVKLVKRSMNFHVSFDYNMQYSIMSRKLISNIGSVKFFQSPYPDYYATNVAFLKAGRILISPLPLVTIGISPKSFGFFYFNQREEEGVEFLKNIPEPELADRLGSIMLPGSNMNSSWLLAMETIRSRYKSEFNLRVNYRRYRVLQVLHLCQNYFGLGTVTKAQMKELWRRLSTWERISYTTRIFAWFLVERVFTITSTRRRSIRRVLGLTDPLPDFNPKKSESRYRNLLEVFEQVEPEAYLHFAGK